MKTEPSPVAETALTQLLALRKLPQSGSVLAAQRKIFDRINAVDALAVALEMARSEVSNG
jgi:hypothetical protein